MAGREVHLELLLGRQVRDSAGEKVGRIEEVRAEPVAGEWIVWEYLIGPAAVLERFSAGWLGRILRRGPGAGQPRAGYRVRWDQLDLTDPGHPRLLCSRAELAPLSTTPEAKR
jgi:hypothetical protein